MEHMIIRYIHFLGIILLSSTLFYECLSVSHSITNAQLKKIASVDRLFGISALIVLVAGALMLLHFGKPTEFYTKNPIFHLKFTLFVVIGLLSILPTVFFLKHRKSTEPMITIPKYILVIVRLEFALLLFIPLCAVLMAHGYGLK